MLSVKPVVHLIHCCKKKNVSLFSYVTIVVHVISYRVSRRVFKLKLANVQQHERKLHKNESFIFFSLGYFSLCCLGFDRYTFYFNKNQAWKIGSSFFIFMLSKQIYPDLLIADESVGQIFVQFHLFLWEKSRHFHAFETYIVGLLHFVSRKIESTMNDLEWSKR